MASWRNQADEEIIVSCPGGHDFFSTAGACAEKLLLADAEWRAKTGNAGAPYYAYGDHVSDPRALVMRFLSMLGWRFVPGTLQKMRCPDHELKVDK